MCIYFGLDLELQFGEIWTSSVKRPHIPIGMLSWLAYFALFAARLLVRVVRWRRERVATPDR